MAAPNILTPTTLTAETLTYAVTDTLTACLSNAADSGEVLKINSIYCANITGSTAESITLTIYDGATDTHLASTISVPVNGTQMLSDRQTYFYLEEGISLRAQASATTSLELVISYEEFSDV